MELRNVTRIPMAALPGPARDELPDFLCERGFRLESELGPDDLARLDLTDGAGRIPGAPSGRLGICLARVHPSAPSVPGAPR
jgi:hypothetical protein